MNFKNGLIIYFVVSLGFLLSEILKIPVLVHVFRLLLMPVVFFSLWRSDTKISVWYVLIMFFYYVGDVCILYPYEISLGYIFFFYGISHLLFAKMSFNLIKNMSVRKLMFSVLPIIILWFVYFNYSVKGIFGESLGGFYAIGILYSISFSLFSIMAIVAYYNNSENKLSFYAVMIAMSFVIADILMGVNLFFSPHQLYEILNVLLQIVGYYYIYLFGIKNNTLKWI